MNGRNEDHSGIAQLKWIERQSGKTEISNVLPILVDFVREHPGQSGVQGKSGKWVDVGVVEAQPPHLRSYADGVYTNNLLELPEF
ncbi:DUF3892 domain-containing protein [Parafrankia sp. BMG5.11]|nr:DUF3892 domain-containing protein [Parafrankia sp. BMG5.11]